LQEGIADRFLERLLRAYATVRIGDPLNEATLMGPLISEQAVEDHRAGLATIQAQGGRLLFGGGVLDDRPGYFVEPAIVRSSPELPVVKEEIFAPILHVFTAADLSEAIAVNNSVPRGLSSSRFTTGLRAAETWLSAAG